ncbi:hypothetical protein AAC691_19005 [Nguyenibacter vanlangensis]|uniref:Uncharacterized protein n=1 Tax=Nguyenibacter vanlangensis TaxID=1216886 RepID=A0ABZ3D3I3_9PROT
MSSPEIVSAMRPAGVSERMPYISRALADVATERLKRIGYFSAADYHDLHRDIKESPYHHALLFGAWEGRQLFKGPAIARALVAAEYLDPAVETGLSEDDARYLRRRGVAIYTSSRGNIFMKEIAEDLGRNIAELEIPVRLLDETAVPDKTAIAIYMAPHEFFLIGQGRRWLSDANIRDAFMYNTEQIPSSWFASAFPALLMAKGIFDISASSAALFQNADIPAMHWEPGLEGDVAPLSRQDAEHPLVKVLPRSARNVSVKYRTWFERPIDINFFGSNSPRRDDVLARCSAPFSRYETCIHYRHQMHGPVGRKFNERALTRVATHVARCSKISLNIHRDEFCYFEWHRMVRQGMAMGSLVVTDHCLPHPRFKPGVHYFEEDARHIPNLVDWILRDEDGQKTALRLIAGSSDLIFDEEQRRNRTRMALNFILSKIRRGG